MKKHILDDLVEKNLLNQQQDKYYPINSKLFFNDNGLRTRALYVCVDVNNDIYFVTRNKRYIKADSDFILEQATIIYQYTK